MHPVGRKDEFGILGCSLFLIGRGLEAVRNVSLLPEGIWPPALLLFGINYGSLQSSLYNLGLFSNLWVWFSLPFSTSTFPTAITGKYLLLSYYKA